jgi:hypothetical protein
LADAPIYISECDWLVHGITAPRQRTA